jgi:hypothetical protein
MQRRPLLGLLPLFPLALAASCAGEPVQIGLVMRAPQGLLDTATAVDLSVFDASKAFCDELTGHVDAIPKGEGTQTFALEQEGCAKDVSWCRTIKLDKDGSKKMFAVTARSAAGLLAEGCAVEAIDQDPLEVTIQMHRYNEPGCCGDGSAQVGEQCDSGALVDPANACGGVVPSAVCNGDCTAAEILLSIDDGALPPKLSNGIPGSKTKLSIAFGPGGVDTPNMLRAVYVNTDPADALGNADVQQRFLAQDLSPIADPVPLSLQLGLPLRCSAVQTSGLARTQLSPALAQITSDTVAVVYQSDEAENVKFDVFLTAQNANGCVDTPDCTANEECATGTCSGGRCAPAIRLSTTGTGSAEDPRVAGGPGGAALVTWSRPDGVYGRIWKPDGTVTPPVSELLIAHSASGARVAGTADGWIVVYQGGAADDADAILRVTIDAKGVVGQPVRVNAVRDGLQDQPDVATLPSGKSIVVFHSQGDVYFQRFDEQGVMLPDDQNAPLNTVGVAGSPGDTDQKLPAVAASVGFGEFFAVVWETIDPATGLSDVAARFVEGKSGFLYNSVSGQNDEFKATDRLVIGERHRPAVAIGGGGYVAIGWEDGSQGHPGVFVRRFPLPTLF